MNCFFCQTKLSKSLRLSHTHLLYCQNCPSFQRFNDSFYSIWNNLCLYNQDSNIWLIALKNLNMIFVNYCDVNKSRLIDIKTNGYCFEINQSVDLDNLTPETLENKVRTWITFS